MKSEIKELDMEILDGEVVQDEVVQDFSYEEGSTHENEEYISVDPDMPPITDERKVKIKGCVNKILLSALCGAVFGAGALSVNYIGQKFIPEQPVNQTEEISMVTATSSVAIESNVSEIASNVMPSIVSITSMSVQEVMSFFGGVNTYESESAGSGIILGKNDKELLILTNNHVVEGSTTLTVTFVDDESIEATVKGGNAGQDIAVISIPIDQISSETMDNIKIATIGDSTQLQAGGSVIAIGNALGYGQSVTTGVISAMGRTVDGIEGELIQTDAAINPGNSGGALLNSNGEVIGINTAKVSQGAVEGMGYAIPITDASETIELLMNRETKTVVDEADRGYLGIQGVSVSEESSILYNMPEGVYIAEVIEDSACHKAGINKGSIITGIDGTSIQDMEDLQEELSYCAEGEEIQVDLEVPENNGEYSEITVTLVLQGR